MMNTKNFRLLLVLLLAGSIFTACKKDDDKQEVIAGFTFTVDENDFRKVTFTNTSQNYESLSWNFGDNSTPSTEVNPVHIYQTMGTFTVTLTASGSDGSKDQFTADIVINDPNAELTKLVGDGSKTWKLLRDVSTGRYPLQVGPASFSTIWWAMGRDNDELANRPCMLNDEWTFTRDGAMKFDAKGDYWAEGGVFFPANVCASTDVMEGLSGEDLSAWGSGNHTYELTSGTQPTLKVIGLGAYIGLCKAATNAEVKVPQESVTYQIIKLTDAAVDTLILQTSYTTGGDAPQPAYWRFVLVHYDNPADEPPIPGPSPTASFSVQQNGNTITITNSTTLATAYLWDFGDGTTSTEENPVHTYATEGAFNIKLTASNPNGISEALHFVFITSTPVTEALLIGSAWKIRSAEKSIFVGPALGSYEWYSVPLDYMTGGGTGPDDWSCIMNDEFIFSTGGAYEYKTNGDARNDGYFGGENGCISDADIAASGNGAAFGSGTHTWSLTPASGSNRAILTLTNGPDRAAFIGFYKGYYGGENTSNTNPPNGGSLTNQYEVMGYANSGNKEYLFVTVDISAAHDGSASWSVVLER
ncbi:MAG: PKD domain-containing protein [Lentimicrobium sp.]|jgi:PKD repeat protein|nr:PKD domain-containing protein [Lentimicrobium sp.]MDD2527416.1 PKD domain-containing protein [Lentimicrobiaceae bacterium]MDD4597584.1 PKD domain-containing protein [Lentimicrobiaceae bacterium]MDY0026198.1 PKD domain-containing protein [Lentimicrobium sp.]